MKYIQFSKDICLPIKELRPFSERAQHFVYEWATTRNRYCFLRLEDVYKKCSTDKHTAYDVCRFIRDKFACNSDILYTDFGTIISYNTFQFTYAFSIKLKNHFTYLIVITKTNYYAIKLD